MPGRAPQVDTKRAEPPLFGAFARELVDSRKGQVSEAMLTKDRWALDHLLPFFENLPLAAIDGEAVDAYRAFKVRESEMRRQAIEIGAPHRDGRGQVLKPQGPSTIDTLQWILSFAL